MVGRNVTNVFVLGKLTFLLVSDVSLNLGNAATHQAQTAESDGPIITSEHHRACDPISAGIIYQSDASVYFDLQVHFTMNRRFSS